MPRLNVPPHPFFDRKCKNCVHWHAELARELVAVNPGTMMPLADAIKQGLPVANLTQSRIAPCIRFPAWVNNDENMYCDEFEQKEDVLTP